MEELITIQTGPCISLKGMAVIEEKDNIHYIKNFRILEIAIVKNNG